MASLPLSSGVGVGQHFIGLCFVNLQNWNTNDESDKMFADINLSECTMVLWLYSRIFSSLGYYVFRGFPGGSARDVGLIPGLERSPGGSQ